MEILCNQTNRRLAGVSPENDYVFASTRLSENHQCGWHAMHNIVEKLDLKKPENIKATTNRHRISTLYATMDLENKEREKSPMSEMF